MHSTKRGFAVIALLSLALSACGGGGGSGGSAPVVPTAAPTNSAGTAQATQTQNDSVAAAEAAGSSVDDLSSLENSTVDPTISGQAVARSAMDGSPSPAPTGSGSPSPSPRPTATPFPFGQCIAGGEYAGIEVFKPDKAGDPNSYEYQFFYDAACTKIARDHIHVINKTTGTTTVTQTSTETDKHYSQSDSVNPTSVSVEVNTITGQFSSSGYPIFKNGFARSSTYSLTENGVVETQRGSETISLPKTSTQQSYCGDSAGFSGEEREGTDALFGYQNVLNSATRTVNADGSVTYSVTGGGSIYTATPPALFTLNTGTLNSACPITTPAFTLSGGTLKSSFGGGTFTVSYLHGSIVSLSIANETLSNGYVLNATSNNGVSPSSSGFITGTIAKSGTTVATFSVDASGDGTLTVVATGATYQMEHWHVTHGHTGSPSPSPSGSPTSAPSSSASPSPSPTHT